MSNEGAPREDVQQLRQRRLNHYYGPEDGRTPPTPAAPIPASASATSLPPGRAATPRTPSVREPRAIRQPDHVTAAKPPSEAKVEPFDDEVPPEFECVLCLRLYYEPVSLPCGHTFCRCCLRRALHHKTCCPVCRAATSPDAANASANVTIVMCIQRGHAPAYAARTLEAAEDEAHEAELKRRALAIGDDAAVSSDGSVLMPVFFLDIVVFPQQPTTLYIFENRYIVMVDRCLSGSRRFVVTGRNAVGAVGSILQIEDARILAARQYLLQCRSVGRCVISTTPEAEPEASNLHYAQVTPFEDDDDRSGLGGTTAAAELLGNELMDSVERAVEVVNRSVEILPQSARQELRRRYGDPPTGNLRSLVRYRKLSFWLPSALNLTHVPGGANRRRAAFLASRSLVERLRDSADIVHGSEAATAATERRRDLAARKLFDLNSGRGAAFLSTACSSIALVAAIFAGLVLWTGHGGFGGNPGGGGPNGVGARFTGL